MSTRTIDNIVNSTIPCRSYDDMRFNLPCDTKNVSSLCIGTQFNQFAYSIIPQYSQWSEFDKCSTTCGPGVMTRHRTCLTKLCDHEDTINRRPCFLGECPVYGPWSLFSTCDQTCGKSYKTRTRSCVSGLCKSENLTQTELCTNIPPCPIYGQWTEFSKCSATCGTGTRTRTRKCLVDNCFTSHLIDQQQCIMPECIVYGEWSAFSTCSSTCGTGQTFRRRKCVSGPCSTVKDDIQIKPCEMPVCIVFGEWSEFTSCSATCGYEQTYRVRKCISGPCHNVTDKIEFKLCDLPACEIYADWSEWSGCNVTCGEGYKTRIKKCNHTSCLEDIEESKKCTANLCINDSIYSEWSEFSTCSTTCGYGEMLRTRKCLIESCLNETLVEKHSCKSIDCPIYGEWSNFGLCSATCNNGTSYRTRQCLTTNCTDERQTINCFVQECDEHSDWVDLTNCTEQIINNNDSIIQLTKIQIKKCIKGLYCKDLYQTVKCVEKEIWYSDWSEYGPCSASCGDGFKYKTRRCLKGDCNPLNLLSIIACNTDTCPNENLIINGDCSNKCGNGTITAVIGNITNEFNCTDYSQCKKSEYSEWTEYSECSVTCGDGFKKRIRKCKNENCESIQETDIIICKNQDCPKWGSWVIIKPCIRDCGDFMIQKRYCYGILCKELEEVLHVSCSNPCPLYGEWSDYSECNVDCGRGIKIRNRDCLSGDCKRHSLTEIISCNNDCPEYSEWGSFSKCSSFGSHGYTMRSRKCINSLCLSDIELYQSHLIDNVTCSFHLPMFSEWIIEKKCSPLCGLKENYMKRSRKCLIDCQNLKNNIETEIIKCPYKHCPKYGYFKWLKPCNNKTCSLNTGIITREGLKPQFDSNQSIFEITCNNECPTYSNWVNITSCSNDCGNGYNMRHRHCLSGNCSLDNLLSNSTCSYYKCPLKWSKCHVFCHKYMCNKTL